MNNKFTEEQIKELVFDVLDANYKLKQLNTISHSVFNLVNKFPFTKNAKNMKAFIDIIDGFEQLTQISDHRLLEKKELQ